MAKTTRSARASQTVLAFPGDLPIEPEPEISKTAREELRRIIAASGRQKGVGIEVHGVASGETRISRSLIDRERAGSSEAFDVDDVVVALTYLRKEIGEKPVEDFLVWFNAQFGYEPKKIETRTLEQRVAALEEQDAEDAKLEATLARRKHARREQLAGVARELERRKDGL